MRDYAKVAPKFWTGQTCKDVRGRGSEGALVALYLMTSPMSNMLGLFCQPMLYMAHETALGLEGASKGLRACIDAGFCRYDEATETVFVLEMASYQIAPSLKASDNRCAGIQRDYDSLPDNPFLGDFFDRYQRAFHLTNRRDWKGASKPLPSQEQEQEQEQEKSSLPAVDAAEAASLELTGGENVVELASQDQRVVDIVLDCYHRLLPACQRVEALTPKRRKRILTANRMARDVCKRQGWSMTVREFWTAYFEECQDDAWLRGDTPNPRNPRWKQNLCTLLDEERFGQIMDQAVAKARGGEAAA